MKFPGIALLASTDFGVMQRSVKRPKLNRFDRLLWAWFCGVWSEWRSALCIVKPGTCGVSLARATGQRRPQFSYQWMGATWLFATAENRDRFQAEPERYAPQYGGYCAYAVSKGRTASIDPEAWRVVDGKLYLNYSKGVQKKWEQDVAGNVSKADKNWPDLHK